MSTPKAEKTERSFEDSMKRLTEIVEHLEKGDLPLETSLTLFEEGVSLANESQKKLQSAEKRIEKLLKVRDGGEAETAPFPLKNDDR